MIRRIIRSNRVWAGLPIALAAITGACGAKKDALVAKASQALSCAPEKLETDTQAPYVEKVEGCGKESVYLSAHEKEEWVSPTEKASKELACAAGKLELTQLREKRMQIGTTRNGPVYGAIYVAEVKGCGKSAVYFSHAQTGWTSPFERAAFEMPCDVSKLSASMIDESTVAVSGCEKKAVYLVSVGGEGAKWVVNN
jgi:hypothetical protein